MTHVLWMSKEFHSNTHWDGLIPVTGRTRIRKLTSNWNEYKKVKVLVGSPRREDHANGLRVGENWMLPSPAWPRCLHLLSLGDVRWKTKKPCWMWVCPSGYSFVSNSARSSLRISLSWARFWCGRLIRVTATETSMNRVRKGGDAQLRK